MNDLNFILKLLQNPDDYIRYIVVDALGSQNNNLPPEIISQLIDLLPDPTLYTPWFYLSAEMALRNIGENLPAEIIKQLVDLLCDPDSYTHAIAVDALGKIINKIPENLIREIEKNLNTDSYQLLKQLYASGRHLSEK